jgi:hypothetical protein
MRSVLFLLGIFLLSSFIFAASSQTAADFSVNVPQEAKIVSNDFIEDSSDNYLGYFILFLIVLITGYFIFSKKKVSKKKKSSRKSKKKK